MRAWQRMLSGRRLDLINPAAIDIEIEDIAHGLSRVARWNGQTTGEYAFSVAQHSLLVEELAVQMNREMSKGWRLAILLHDAPEYVIGDMISPFKAALGLNYRTFEHRLEAAIHIRFGLPVHIPDEIKALIKASDRACAHFEAVQLAGFTPTEGASLFGSPPEGYHNDIEPMSTRLAQERFLARFHVLSLAAGFATTNSAFDTE